MRNSGETPRKLDLIAKFLGESGICAQAGFECKPKVYWFPKNNSDIAVLSDGTEVDLEELKQNVMKI